MIRVGFGHRGTTIRGWPSTGGIYLFDDADAVVLDFLQLDRFTETPGRSSIDDPEEEDAFCRRLCLIGAGWWSSEEAHFENERPPALKRREDGRPITLETLWLGWQRPVNGVSGLWALSLDEYDGRIRGVGRIKNARNMEERCRVIEMLGGVFHSDGEGYLRDIDRLK